MVDVGAMEKRDDLLEAINQQILTAHARNRFNPELIQKIGEHSRRRRAEGRTPAYIADELGISEWQVVDWIHEVPREQQPQQGADERRTPLMFEFKVPLTSRLERLLVREVSRAMQHCDSCCWSKFVDSLPGHLRTEKEDE